MVCALSTSRIRTECGIPTAYFTPYYPYLLFLLLGGLSYYGLETFVLAFVAGGFMMVAQFLLFAPTQVEMFQLSEVTHSKTRSLKWAMIIGALAGIFIGGYFMLVWANGRGGQNIRYMNDWAIKQDWYFGRLSQEMFNKDGEILKAATGGADAPTQSTKLGPRIALGAGAGITIILAVLRTQFVGFWLHPIGYILANTYCIHGIWGSFLVAWVIKFLSLKIGGPRFIRERMTPFFAGLFVGAVVMMAFWDVIAVVRGAMNIQPVYTFFP